MSLHLPRFEEVLACSRGRNCEAPSLWHDLAGDWTMLQGGGHTLYDVSGYDNHGTLTNMDPATDWVIRRIGHGLAFDGANDYVSLPDLNEGTSRLSVFCWLNTADTDNKQAMGHYQTTTGNRAWKIGVANDDWAAVTGDELAVVLSTDGSIDFDKIKIYWGSTAGDEIADGEDHYIGFTWDAGTLALFVDGREIAVTKDKDAAFVTIHNSNSAASIGAANPDSGGVENIAATIYDGAIWNRVLTLSEIQLLYADPHAHHTLRSKVFPAAAAPVVGQPTMKRWQHVPGMHNYLRSAG